MFIKESGLTFVSKDVMAVWHLIFLSNTSVDNMEVINGEPTTIF